MITNCKYDKDGKRILSVLELLALEKKNFKNLEILFNRLLLLVVNMKFCCTTLDIKLKDLINDHSYLIKYHLLWLIQQRMQCGNIEMKGIQYKGNPSISSIKDHVSHNLLGKCGKR